MNSGLILRFFECYLVSLIRVLRIETFSCWSVAFFLNIHLSFGFVDI